MTMLLVAPTWACGGGSGTGGETTPTDETYTTSGEEVDREDPPEPEADDPL